MEDNYLFAPEQLETNQFIVRSYHPGDGPLLSEAVTSSYEHLREFMPWAKREQSDEESERLVRTFRGHYLLAEDFTLGIFSPDETMLLGGTGYHLRNGSLRNRSAEIGMWIRASYAGQGLGATVLRALIQWGFEVWPWEHLTWRCSTRNLPSTRTAERAGMIHDGTLRGNLLLPNGRRDDVHCFSLLRRQWLERTGK